MQVRAFGFQLSTNYFFLLSKGLEIVHLYTLAQNVETISRPFVGQKLGEDCGYIACYSLETFVNMAT